MLTIQDLQSVRQAIWESRVKWFDIGIELGMKVDQLQVIKANCSGNLNDCFTDMLIKFLNGIDPEPTWLAIIEALQQPTVGYGQIAQAIQKSEFITALPEQSHILSKEKVLSDPDVAGFDSYHSDDDVIHSSRNISQPERARNSSESFSLNVEESSKDSSYLDSSTGCETQEHCVNVDTSICAHTSVPSLVRNATPTYVSSQSDSDGNFLSEDSDKLSLEASLHVNQHESIYSSSSNSEHSENGDTAHDSRECFEATVGKCQSLALHNSPSKSNGRSDVVQTTVEGFNQFYMTFSSNVIPPFSGCVSRATYSIEDMTDGTDDDNSLPHESNLSRSKSFSCNALKISSQVGMHSNRNVSTTQQRQSLTRRHSLTSLEESNDSLNAHNDLEEFVKQLQLSLTPEHERILNSLEKLRKMSIRLVKVHNVDNSTKVVRIKDGMNALDMCMMLAKRNHQDIGPNWTVVERLSQLGLERPLEDHEIVTKCIRHWPRHDQSSYLMFKNNPEKHYLLLRPQLLVPASHEYSSCNALKYSWYTEDQRRNCLLKEFFEDGRLPETEGELQVSYGRSQSWRKVKAVVRKSGLYTKKGTRHYIIARWQDVDCYSGNQYGELYKAPGRYCFSLVPTDKTIDNTLINKIVHLCVPGYHDLKVWITSIRLAKYGNQLFENYEEMKKKMPWLVLEDYTLVHHEAAPLQSLLPTNEHARVANSESEQGIRRYYSFSIKSPIRRNKVNRADSDRKSRNYISPYITKPLPNKERIPQDAPKKTVYKHTRLVHAFQDAWKKGCELEEVFKLRSTKSLWCIDRLPSFERTQEGHTRYQRQRSRSHEEISSDQFKEYSKLSKMFTVQKSDVNAFLSP